MSSIDIQGDPTFTKLLGAQTHVLNQVLNYANTMSLKCAVQLGIPDVIHRNGKPVALSELLTLLKIHPSKSHSLHRLLRILCQSGFFSKVPIHGDGDDNEGYVLTDTSRLLLSDNPFNMSVLVLGAFNPFVMNSWHHLPTWFQQNNDDGNNLSTPFEIAYGMPIWDYCSKDPTFNQSFYDFMATETRLFSTILINKAREVFEGLNSLVDVGGGTGILATAIAKAFPHLTCTVLDLPQAVANLQDDGNLKYVAGNMFESIPPADALLLKLVLHDWGDDECVKILKKCKDTIKDRKGAKVMVIDIVIGNGTSADEDEAIETTKLCNDMEILIMAGGQERNEKEWAKLFSDSGFNGYKIIPILGLRSLIEVYP